MELQKAIEKKARQMACETHIVCKHFLKAIEDKKYGWFWECPDQLNLLHTHYHRMVRTTALRAGTCVDPAEAEPAAPGSAVPP